MEDHVELSNVTTTTLKSLHIAPMLNVSNREFRRLFRILSKHCVLWTEMVVDETIVHSNHLDMWLGYDPIEHPVVCQIGGNNPELCGIATRIVQEQYNYDEVNLNMDCPSDRVAGQREFGAILMKRLDATVKVLESMRANADSKVPISVKCRIGVDDHDDLDYVVKVIRTLSPVCQRFILHARKCVLGGLLTPTQNRIVPPLNYPRVYALCDMFPDCEFWINGGIPGLKAAKLLAYGTIACGVCAGTDLLHNEHHAVPCSLCNVSNGSCTAPLQVAPANLRGCMLGRAAMDHPSMFWDVDRYFYGAQSNPCQNRRQVLIKYCEYLEITYPRRCCDSDERVTTRIPVPDVVREQEYCDCCRSMYTEPNVNKTPVTFKQRLKDNSITPKISSRILDRSFKPIHGMFFGLPKNRAFRRACDDLSRDMTIRNCGPGFILRTAMLTMPANILDQDFIKVEHLVEGDIQVHTAPRHN